MAQLQEAQFACFEDEELDSSSNSTNALLSGDFALHHHHQLQHQSGLKTFAIAEPSGATRSLAQKSFARGALLLWLVFYDGEYVCDGDVKLMVALVSSCSALA